MKTFHFTQYSPEWWEARRGIPTASVFDKVITPKTGKLSASADDLIAELIAQRVTVGTIAPPDFASPAMRNGTFMEPEARNFYCMEREADVQEVGFCLDDTGRFGCSPDGLVGEDGGLECKCPTLKTQVKYLLAGVLPDEYKAQVHGSLIVTGREWWDFLSYAPGLDPLLIRVAPDAFTDLLSKALEDFHGKYMDALKRLGMSP